MRPLRRTVRRALALATAAAPAVVLTACSSIPFIGRSHETWGFAAPWDPRSTRSLAAHAAALDVAVTGWIALDSLTGAPRAMYTDSSAALATSRFAFLTSFGGDRFRTDVVRALGADAGAAARTAGATAALLAAGGYRGLVIDFEGHTAADRAALLRVVAALADSAHARGVGTVAVALPAADTANYPARPFLEHADLVVVMLYDEHWAGSGPGSIASPAWVRARLQARVGEVGPSRIVAALPVYGYRWPVTGAAEVISYRDAERLAGEAGMQLVREPSTLELRATRANEWQLWIGDAETLRGLRTNVEQSGIRRVALWRLGLEDPQIWAGGGPGR
jgi:peptidoglycan-N-acetylglucosamine deacetylase